MTRDDVNKLARRIDAAADTWGYFLTHKVRQDSTGYVLDVYNSAGGYATALRTPQQAEEQITLWKADDAPPPDLQDQRNYNYDDPEKTEETIELQNYK